MIIVHSWLHAHAIICSWLYTHGYPIQEQEAMHFIFIQNAGVIFTKVRLVFFWHWLPPIHREEGSCDTQCTFCSNSKKLAIESLFFNNRGIIMPVFTSRISSHMHSWSKLQHGFLPLHSVIWPLKSCRKDIVYLQLVPNYVHVWVVHSVNPDQQLFIAHSFEMGKCIQCQQTLSLCKEVAMPD